MQGELKVCGVSELFKRHIYLTFSVFLFLLITGNFLEDTVIIFLNTKIIRPAVWGWRLASASLLCEFVFSGEVRE
jgi:hypothetical protein